ncbi:MAG TPA: endonuclease/exonuclease/phosphatase family protein [Anaerolineae bacterium]|nr:endonuclease/exonuclease/phosphatase family protein [Anaerolineae bacterium]
MTKIRQVAVARPVQADPYHVFGPLIRTLTGHPAGRWLLDHSFSKPLRAFFGRALRSLAGPDHLTFKALPARPLVKDEGRLTVITANLWHDWPRHRQLRERLEAFARLVEREKADTVLLQEVARTADLRADEWLAERLGMAYAYGQANGDSRINAFEEGVAILSRYPLAEPQICHLAPKPLSLVRRLAVAATVKAPSGDFLAVSAHLGHGRKLNTRQLTALQEWVSVQAGHRPAIIGGDFNTGERSPQIQALQDTWVDLYRAVNQEDDGITYQLHWPWGDPLLRMRLDYLFLRRGRLQEEEVPWKVLEAKPAEMHGLPHSDHQAVVARLVPQA